jgi:hypothetical protein
MPAAGTAKVWYDQSLDQAFSLKESNMAKRPPLSESSFLGFVFKPSKHQQPSGLRKRPVVGVKGRNPRRVRAYNKLSAVNQEILKRSGQKDAYLKGDSTIGTAKRILREKAVALHIAKPLKPRRGPIPRPEDRRDRLDAMIQRHLRTVIVDQGLPFNSRTSDDEIAYLDPETGMLQWDYGKVKYAGRKDSEYEVVGADGKTHNPFWYH